MSKIFVVNSGSSSIKFQLLEMPGFSLVTSGMIEKIGEEESVFQFTYLGNKVQKEFACANHDEALAYLMEELKENGIIENFDEIVACGHRVAHGGENFKGSTLIDENVAAEIEALASLAPLHNPANIQGYYVLKRLLKNAIHVATFDTSFHQTIKDDVYIYPIPYVYYEKYKVRKYGFHGTSHRFVSQELRKLLGNENSKRLIVCHLGNGASVSAIKDGYSINTSMGVSPLGGILMGTRCGNIDPSIVEFLCLHENKDVSTILNELNKESGLLGISGVSNDMRLVSTSALEGNERAMLALKVYARRVAEYIGSYFIELGGVDAIAFTAGVGENSSIIRKMIIELIQDALGVMFDDDKNNHLKKDGIECISSEGTKVKIFVVPTNEEAIIAEDTYAIYQSLLA